MALAAAMAVAASIPAPTSVSAAGPGNWGTILVPGGQWAGPAASLGDLNVYSNGSSLSYSEPGPYGPIYQCTELAARWAAVRFGEPVVWNTNANGYWAAGPNMPIPFIQHPNGGADGPQFGDLLVFGSTSYDPTGHIAVVSGTGPGYVDVVEQNWSATSGRATLPISGTTMPARWGLPVLGWLRASTAPAGWTGLEPGQHAPQLPLGRYYQPGDGHWVTTNFVPPSWSSKNPGTEESVLGSLSPYPDASLQALYSCQIAWIHFISLASNCEGGANLGIDGYDSPTLSAPYSLQLWRCRVAQTNDHFVSIDPACEGQTSEGSLGFDQPSQPMFRYYAPGVGHWSAAGSATGSFNVESTLGWLTFMPDANSHYLYSCRAGAAGHFTSTDPNCEGQTVLGADGAAANTQVTGSVPLYRCDVRASGDHFDTQSSTCEGNGVSEGILGYVQAVQPT